MALRRRFGRFNGDLLNITRMIKRMVRALWDLFVVGDDDNNNNNNNGGDDDHDGYHGGGGGNDDDDDDRKIADFGCYGKEGSTGQGGCLG
ncbi:hypothetical protein NFJ02_29g69350 [Pycnococcus provasolii]